MTAAIAIAITTLGCAFAVSALAFFVVKAYAAAIALFLLGLFCIVLGSALLEGLHKHIRRR